MEGEPILPSRLKSELIMCKAVLFIESYGKKCRADQRLQTSVTACLDRLGGASNVVPSV